MDDLLVTAGVDAYLLRLSEENGYETPAVVVGMVEHSSEYQVTLGWDFGKLRDLLGPYSGLPASFGYGQHGQRRQVSVLLQSERVPVSCIDPAISSFVANGFTALRGNGTVAGRLVQVTVNVGLPTHP